MPELFERDSSGDLYCPMIRPWYFLDFTGKRRRRRLDGGGGGHTGGGGEGGGGGGRVLRRVRGGLPLRLGQGPVIQGRPVAATEERGEGGGGRDMGDGGDVGGGDAGMGSGGGDVIDMGQGAIGGDRG
ncbi:uncharacterized protein LOC131856716 [Cryptomeria japonica]|uniref:uncharacterized protein LOC131856716 n=1 Tax=Cryptomeria japonica TaxID=3369 RepID=UPI0027DA19BC|nr:uncharacterized protein LOC131856716 [Cryptomeria japonica]